MAFCRPNWLNTCARTATSPSHEGVEGTAVGAIWIGIEGCVILFLCLLSREKDVILIFPLYKKTQFLSLLPVSRRFTPYQSWLCNLIAYVVGPVSGDHNSGKHRHLSHPFCARPSPERTATTDNKKKSEFSLSISSASPSFPPLPPIPVPPDHIGQSDT